MAEKDIVKRLASEVERLIADHERISEVCRHLTEERDKLQQYLAEQGVETLIHYPIAPHEQECYGEYAHLSLPITEEIHRTELSLPIGPTMTLEEAQKVVEAVNGFAL